VGCYNQVQSPETVTVTSVIASLTKNSLAINDFLGQIKTGSTGRLRNGVLVGKRCAVIPESAHLTDCDLSMVVRLRIAIFDGIAILRPSRLAEQGS